MFYFNLSTLSEKKVYTGNALGTSLGTNVSLYMARNTFATVYSTPQKLEPRRLEVEGIQTGSSTGAILNDKSCIHVQASGFLTPKTYPTSLSWNGISGFTEILREDADALVNAAYPTAAVRSVGAWRCFFKSGLAPKYLIDSPGYYFFTNTYAGSVYHKLYDVRFGLSGLYSMCDFLMKYTPTIYTYKCEVQFFSETATYVVLKSLQYVDKASKPGVWAILDDCFNNETGDPYTIWSNFNPSAYTPKIATTAQFTEKRTLVNPDAILDKNIQLALWRCSRRVVEASYMFLTKRRLDVVREHNIQQELVRNCLLDVRNTQVNTLAYIRDLKLFLNEIPAALKVYRNPIDLKAWSSLWLASRYGSRLTVSDTEAFVSDMRLAMKALRKAHYSWSFTRARYIDDVCPLGSAFISWTEEYNAKLYFSPNVRDVMVIVRNLLSWGIIPHLEQIWDLIPLSFVVDWFLNISALAEFQDLRVDQQMIRVKQYVASRKLTACCDVPLVDLGYDDINMDITIYERIVGFSLPSLSLPSLFGTGSPINIIDGLSLLLQKFL